MTENPVCFPDYTRGILNLTTAILKHYGVDPPFPALAEATAELSDNPRTVILMVLDGLGVDLLEKSLPENAFLRQKTRAEISSVFPPTTAAATSTLYSGLPPIEHGWLGWDCYFKEKNQVIELFLNRDFYTYQPVKDSPVQKELAYEHIFSKIKKASPKTDCCESFPPFKPNGCKSFGEMCGQVLSFAKKAGNRFILAYWPDPDHISHEEGPYSPAAKKCVVALNAAVERLAADLPKNTVMFITADHGHLPVETAVYVEDCGTMADCLRLPLSLDDRSASVFVKTGREDEFTAQFDRFLSADFLLFTRAEVAEKKLFGTGTPHRRAADFIGDYLIVSKSYKSFRQHTPLRAECAMKGAHSGLTRIEMRVPLIVVKK